MAIYTLNCYIMNILTASFRYIEDILNENCGVKALITDAETLTTLSLSMTRTELFSHDVINTEELSEVCSRPVNPIVSALKCVCILRPSKENFDLLSNELSNTPHFSRYSMYFTNTLLEPEIRRLAQSDKFGLVDHIEEIYIDFYPLNKRLFSLNYPSITELRVSLSADLLLNRITDGVFASLCALQLTPTIRYANSSPLCKLFAKSIFERINRSRFTPQSGEQTLLLILDRISDPLTPLLHPWFYSGTIHDLFGIKNNLVNLPLVNEPIVYDERHDTFIQEYGTSFLADVGPAVAQRMTQAKQLSQSAKQEIKTPDQIASVVNAASQFQEQFSVAGNHVRIFEAINATVNSSSLINIGEIEQALAISDDMIVHYNEIIKVCDSIQPSMDDILRLLLIYCLRYEGRGNEQISSLKSKFPSCVPIMDAALKVAGKAKRKGDDKFRDDDDEIDIFGNSKRKITQIFTDIKALCIDEQSQVLDQHKCILSSILEKIKRGQLSTESYPYMGINNSNVYSYNDAFRPKKIVVFYMGGTTYYEMRTAAQITDMDVIVGGTTVHNATSFVQNEIKPFCK